MSLKPIRSFTDLIPVLNRGRFSEKLDEHLTRSIEHLEALPDQQGKATITVTLTVAYQEGRIEVVPSVRSKLPEEKGFTGTPFWAVEGGFSVQHPSQSDMFAGPRSVRERDAG
ncbi:hypothetical protein ACQVP2_22440 [Methylobacterium aquaticum]|uniref:hypothetical protein n=1 Tax=Methylobacterium aquaticum TaxID=270351 RepID=UPI003D170ABF